MRIVFPLIAQQHQMLHALPIAFEIAARHPDCRVEIACLTRAHLDFARSLAALYPDAPATIRLMPLSPHRRARIARAGLRVTDRLVGLFQSRRDFATADAIVVPEATSLQLRRMGVRRPKMIWTGHGAGDRAIGFASHLRKFDFLSLPGRKVEQRMLEKGLIRPGAYHAGTYAKFDIVRRRDAHGHKLFDNDRPTILYNPHFVKRFSSWWKVGRDILSYFAAQDRYNLLFAPHFRLFDSDRAAGETLRSAYAGHAHILIDPGSQRSIDMTYTLAADLYIGDVSSQVAEFMIRPRPCLFINAHHVRWQHDPNYKSWTLGPVIDETGDLDTAIRNAFQTHTRFLEPQREYVLETFENTGETPTAPAAADAITEFLRRTARCPAIQSELVAA